MVEQEKKLEEEEKKLQRQEKVIGEQEIKLDEQFKQLKEQEKKLTDQENEQKQVEQKLQKIEELNEVQKQKLDEQVQLLEQQFNSKLQNLEQMLKEESIQNEGKLSKISSKISLNRRFEMKNFSHEKAKDSPDSWKSPAMYTQLYGYKFCIVVYANGVVMHVGRLLMCVCGQFQGHMMISWNGLQRPSLL